MMAISRKIALGLAALLTMSALSVVAVRAQEPASAPEQKAAEQKNDVAQAEHQTSSPAQRLAHESREAAGEEEDETAQFKQSAAVRLIAKWTGLELRQAYWICMLLNFAVIAGVIGWAGRKVLPGMFRDRTAAIQKAMQEAQKASAEARAKLAEIESRLAKLDSEIAAIRDSAEKEAAAEEARIKAAAEEDARKIIAAAEQEIAAAAKAARRQLTAHAADLAVNLAQKQIHVDAGTDQNLIRNFAGQLGAETSGKDRN